MTFFAQYLANCVSYIYTYVVLHNPRKLNLLLEMQHTHDLEYSNKAKTQTNLRE